MRNPLAARCRPWLLPLLGLATIALVDPGVAAGHEDGLGRPSFGLKGGFALAQHQGIEPRDMEYTVASEMRRAAGGGVFLYLPLTRRFGLQQEVLYVQKGSRQDIGVDIFDIPTVLNVTYDQDYLQIPVLTRFNWVLDRKVDVYSLAGFGFAIKMNDHYRLTGTVDDDTESVPLSADSDMSEVDLFDFFFTYGVGLEMPAAGRRIFLEYRFDLSLHALPLPTYAYVPFGDEQLLVENEPVPLRNQCHMLMLGVRF